MSASRFLAELWQQGVSVRLSSDRSRIVVPRQRLTPEMRVRLDEDRPQLLQLLTLAEDYRLVIRNERGRILRRGLYIRGRVTNSVALVFSCTHR